MPSTLTRWYRSTSYIDWPVPVSAARWTTDETPAGTAAQAVSSATSATTTCAGEGGDGGVGLGVHLRVQQVEGDDLVAGLDEPSREVLADEAGAAGEQDGHQVAPTTRAGTPATVAPAGTSRVTTAPAPTVAPSPMVTPPRTTAR